MVILTVVSFAGFVHPASARYDDNTEAAVSFIQDLSDKALAYVKQSSGGEDFRGKFEQLLREGFNLRYIGAFTLGRYWRVATDEQKSEYLNLFEQMIVDVYSDRFAEYADNNFEITGAEVVSERGPRRDVIVHMVLQPAGGSEPVPVDWRVREKGEDRGIIDVSIGGVSMSVTQRSEFASIIQKNGGKVESLLKSLRERRG